jgi:SAM-dependent methyltransferase
VVNQRAADKGLSELITTQQVDFDHFELSENGFDMVIDRLSVTHAPRKNAATVFSRLYDMLNEGGIVLSNLFALDHSHKDFGCYDADLDVWKDFSDGIFAGLLSASFYGEQDVRDLFKQYTLAVLRCEIDRDFISNQEQKAIWKIVAQK